mmetsp:Transcript_3331/g.12090  ORF Transcript_3331/g.12090 Transcript_3331/m.12090 type:complete len:298 (-) Transcript_3331:1556-2449(-)
MVDRQARLRIHLATEVANGDLRGCCQTEAAHEHGKAAGCGRRRGSNVHDGDGRRIVGERQRGAADKGAARALRARVNDDGRTDALALRHRARDARVGRFAHDADVAADSDRRTRLAKVPPFDDELHSTCAVANAWCHRVDTRCQPTECACAAATRRSRRPARLPEGDNDDGLRRRQAGRCVAVDARVVPERHDAGLAVDGDDALKLGRAKVAAAQHERLASDRASRRRLHLRQHRGVVGEVGAAWEAADVARRDREAPEAAGAWRHRHGHLAARRRHDPARHGRPQRRAGRAAVLLH